MVNPVYDENGRLTNTDELLNEVLNGKSRDAIRDGVHQLLASSRAYDREEIAFQDARAYRAEQDREKFKGLFEAQDSTALQEQHKKELDDKQKEIDGLKADKERLAPSYLAKELEAANKKAADLEAAGKAKDDKINLQAVQIAGKAPIEYRGIIENLQTQLTAAQAKANEPALKAQAAANDLAKKDIETREKAIQAFHKAQKEGTNPEESYLQELTATRKKELDERTAAIEKRESEMRAREKTFFPELEARGKAQDAREAALSKRESAIGVRESAAGQQFASGKTMIEEANQRTRMANAKAEAADADRTKYGKLLGELMAGNISPEEAQRAKRQLEREEEEKTRRQQSQAISLDKKKDASQQGIGKALMAGGVVAALGAAAFVAVTVMTGGASLAALPVIMAMVGGGSGLAVAAFGYKQYRDENKESLQAGRDLGSLKFEQSQNQASLNERALMSGRAANRSFDATSIAKDQAPATGKAQAVGRS